MEPRAEPGKPTEGLLAQAQAGDASAFWRLVADYRPYLRSVASRLMGHELASKVDASDVVQQCLLTAYERFAQFRGDSPEQWQHWLLALVRNQTRKLARYWHQQRRDVRRDQALSAESSGDQPLASGSSSPSQKAARRQRAARLLEALGHLPHDYREVIRLRYLENLPYAEIALRLKRSEEAVRKLAERAHRQLRLQCEDLKDES
jgi:RNA polymerase sigma-70 factor (ECF subfamily)